MKHAEPAVVGDGEDLARALGVPPPGTETPPPQGTDGFGHTASFRDAFDGSEAQHHTSRTPPPRPARRAEAPRVPHGVPTPREPANPLQRLHQALGAFAATESSRAPQAAGPEKQRGHRSPPRATTPMPRHDLAGRYGVNHTAHTAPVTPRPARPREARGVMGWSEATTPRPSSRPASTAATTPRLHTAARAAARPAAGSAVLEAALAAERAERAAEAQSYRRALAIMRRKLRSAESHDTEAARHGEMSSTAPSMAQGTAGRGVGGGEPTEHRGSARRVLGGHAVSAPAIRPWSPPGVITARSAEGRAAPVVSEAFTMRSPSPIAAVPHAHRPAGVPPIAALSALSAAAPAASPPRPLSGRTPPKPTNGEMTGERWRLSPPTALFERTLSAVSSAGFESCHSALPSPTQGPAAPTGPGILTTHSSPSSPAPPKHHAELSDTGSMCEPEPAATSIVGRVLQLFSPRRGHTAAAPIPSPSPAATSRSLGSVDTEPGDSPCGGDRRPVAASAHALHAVQYEELAHRAAVVAQEAAGLAAVSAGRAAVAERRWAELEAEMSRARVVLLRDLDRSDPFWAA